MGLHFTKGKDGSRRSGSLLAFSLVLLLRKSVVMFIYLFIFIVNLGISEKGHDDRIFNLTVP